ncbi:uncharacterized protein LOC129570283 [Sitodiplosis mosellana]|uniref:uncharacterized protein LOC129570283 n=1 Tax=Sitodiplosis mosellana TaxID=263140 RepID=UPI0024438C20|nr:uncharacterized protein LOC129570283 [Sitodiplosis mosellana]
MKLILGLFIVIVCLSAAQTETVDTEPQGDARMGAKHGRYFVVNSSGQVLQRVFVKHHTVKNHDPNSGITTYTNLENNQLSHPTPFIYYNGAFSPFDHWYLEVTTQNGQIYKTKTNFYCNVSIMDNGDVYITIDQNLKLKFTFSSSSSCTEELLIQN